MNPKDFDTQILRLKQTYGEKAYPDERVKLLWREVQPFSAGWFEKAIDSLIQTCSFAPLKELSEAIAQERMSQYQANKHNSQTGLTTYSCGHCRDSGAFLCTHVTLPGVWAFRCHCPKGSTQGRNYPVYNKSHESEYIARSA